nr:protein walls are thin 1 [Quercus suber]
MGLSNTSATFASATENFVPAITFLMASIFRMEQVHLNRKDGLAKFVAVAALFEKDSQVWIVHSIDEIFTIFYMDYWSSVN